MKTSGRGENDRWLDEIAFRDQKGETLPTSFDEWKGRDFAAEDESMSFYNRRIPAVVVAISVAAKCSPETIMKISEWLQPIVDELLKREKQTSPENWV